ncbi:MAG: site-2 protease family protein [Prochloraceae cyanobacterium]
MFNGSETTSIFFIILIIVGFAVWGYNRAKAYGKLGTLAWLQSIVLIVPWLVFLVSFALGIYLNLVAILFLIVASTIAYISVGNRLRIENQEKILRQRAADAIEKDKQVNKNLDPIDSESKIIETEAEAETPQSSERGGDRNKLAPEILPIQEEDLQIIKSIFGIDTFFATETISYQEGAIFKGNLRGEAEATHARLTEKLKAALGDKYRLFLVESPEAKPVVIVLPASNDPQPSTLAQKNFALVLFVATIVTGLETAGLLLGFDLFTNFDRYPETVPISLGLWTILIAHEIGHRFAAGKYNIRLSLPYFIPSLQIGTFGAITRFESLIPNRTALFDVAIAGPAWGAIVSLLMLVFGLIISSPGSNFQIETQFFQTSILVGSIARIFLGSQMSQTLVAISPLVVIGWLGLAISALNLMPAGQLDGGRIVQAIYGRKIARRTTIATLIVLAIVAIANPGNAIALYWGILILFLQRDLERPSLNELSEPNDTRAVWGLVALFLMLATLIPFTPTLAARLGIGG